MHIHTLRHRPPFSQSAYTNSKPKITWNNAFSVKPKCKNSQIKSNSLVLFNLDIRYATYVTKLWFLADAFKTLSHSMCTCTEQVLPVTPISVPFTAAMRVPYANQDNFLSLQINLKQACISLKGFLQNDMNCVGLYIPMSVMVNFKDNISKLKKLRQTSKEWKAATTIVIPFY